MRVGSLVRQENYGAIGVVTEMIEQTVVYVSWLTTPNLDPLWYCDDLEMLCR